MNLSWRLAALKNGFQDATAYRIEFLFEVLGAAFVPAAIQIMLWYALYKIGGAQEVGGMRYEDMIRYTLLSILFTQIRGGDHDFELQEMIRTGTLSNYLIRPVGVVEFVYVRGIAPKLFLAALCFVIGASVGWFYGLSPFRIFGAMVLALIGNVIHYQISAALAATAFYWEESFSVLMVKNMVVSLLSGELIPLYLFPSSWSWVWKSTPFYLYVFGPVQFAQGTWSVAEYFAQLAIAGCWCLFGWILIRVSWGLGIKKYVSVGG